MDKPVSPECSAVLEIASKVWVIGEVDLVGVDLDPRIEKKIKELFKRFQADIYAIAREMHDTQEN